MWAAKRAAAAKRIRSLSISSELQAEQSCPLAFAAPNTIERTRPRVASLALIILMLCGVQGKSVRRKTANYLAEGSGDPRTSGIRGQTLRGGG